MAVGYLGEAPLNWCPLWEPCLLARTADGRSEGNHPVFRRPMKQWMMRITAYADRLLEDLDTLDWTDSIKTMQRNWIGRPKGRSQLFDFRRRIHQSVHHPTGHPLALTWCLPPVPVSGLLVTDDWPDGTPGWTVVSSPRSGGCVSNQLQVSDLERQRK